MQYIPFTEGGPMYCLMSARSTNAKSIFSVMFDVVRMTTLECLEDRVVERNKSYIRSNKIYTVRPMRTFARKPFNLVQLGENRIDNSDCIRRLCA